MQLCLGKTPARPNSIKFKLNEFLGGTKPIYPKEFGHEEYTPPVQWGMLGNDQYGVCVVAGGVHETMLWNRMANQPKPFTTNDVLKDFTAITGLIPAPDHGADMQRAASYRLKTGLRDALGGRHKIGAYLEIQVGNETELLTACYLFGAVGIGIQVYSSIMDDFRNRNAWGSRPNGGQLEGYHYVPVVAYRSNLVVVTWGRFQAMRGAFYIGNCDEAIAYVSPEQLTDGKSPEGFDYAKLKLVLSQLA